MTERYTEFLVDLTGKSPRNLKDSIRRVLNASAGFRQSWLNLEQAEGYKTSQEAFEHLDYIQNELLRQRDVHKSKFCNLADIALLFCANHTRWTTNRQCHAC